MKNLKDNLSNIIKYLYALAIGVLALPTFAKSYDVIIILPNYVKIICVIILGLSGYLGFTLIGKNPNGTKKSENQIDVQNQQSK